jgi:hypothetical protein
MIELLTAAKRGESWPFCTAFICAEAGAAHPYLQIDAPRSRGRSAQRESDDTMPQANDTTHGKERPSQPIPPQQRRRLVKRLWRTAERQVAEIDRRLAAMRDDPQSLEREAKTLALVARTVRDLVALEQEAAPAPRSGEERDGRTDTAFIDVNAFRRELAFKLDQLRAGGAGPGIAGEPHPARA